MLALLLLLADLGEPTARVSQLRDFASISPAGVEALDGRRVLLRVERDSRIEEEGDWFGFDCAGPNPDDELHRTCVVPAGSPVDGILVVRGQLRVIHHGRSADGLFLAFVELRLVGQVVRVVEE
jgi:hypothetical protein